MLYLLDANVLISAANGLYQLDRVPQYWRWLEEMGRSSRVAVPREIWEEFNEGNDSLGAWARSPSMKRSLLFEEEPIPGLVQRVVARGYGADLTDTEVGELGRDLGVRCVDLVGLINELDFRVA